MTHTVDSIRNLILTREDALEKAILRVFESQTESEQSTDQTKEENGIGFNGVDAPFLSSLAKQIQANKYGKPLGQRLSWKQREIARKKMVKYARQIFTIFVKPNQQKEN